MSPLLIKKLSLAALVALSVLTGMVGLSLVFIEDPRIIATREYALSQDLAAEGSKNNRRYAQAQAAILSALRHDPYAPDVWVALWRLEKNRDVLAAGEAKLVATRLDPRLLPMLSRSRATEAR
jgi:hypothetical protein